MPQNKPMRHKLRINKRNWMHFIEDIRKIGMKQIARESKWIAYIQYRYGNTLTMTISAVASILGTHYAYLLICPALFWFNNSDPVSDIFQLYALGLVGVVAWSNYWSGFLKVFLIELEIVIYLIGYIWSS